MLIKSICLFTLACLMQVLSFGFHTGHIVFRMAPGIMRMPASNQPGQEEIARENDEVQSGRTFIYPSPLQFTN